MKVTDRELLVNEIRSQYIESENTQLDELKKLDAKVKRPAVRFAYVFGTISALVMGAGMSLIMTDVATMIGLDNPMPVGIGVGILGMMMTLMNYPIYKRILSSRKKKYAAKIIQLSEQLIKE